MVADVRLPDKWSKGSAGGPMFDTEIVQTDGGDEYRNQRWTRPLWRYEIAHNIKSPADISALRAFHLARRGRSRAFLFKDWLDYSSNDDGVTAATALDQPLGTGNGVQTIFNLIKRYDDSVEAYDRAILWPVTGSVLVAKDGVLFAPGYTVQRGAGTITFAAAPANGVVLTAGFQFDVPVRFDDDWLSVTWDTINSRSAGSVPLMEVRA